MIVVMQMMQRASLCRYEGLLMAKIRMMPVEAVEGGRLVVVVSSKVSSNFLLTTSLIAASDVWYHSSMVVGVSIQHISLLHRHRQRGCVCVCGSAQ